MSYHTVLFFAKLREQTGAREIRLELPENTTVRTCKNILQTKYPSLDVGQRHVFVSVNREFANDDDIIPSDAEIALFPPVSGGAHIGKEDPSQWPTIYTITDQSLDLNKIVAEITTATTGAVVVFTGIVRGLTTRGKVYQTEYLEYEAYLPMAEEKMRQITAEIRFRWPEVEGIAIIQRTGHLEASAPTTVIACAASHRDSGVFEAARYGLERLKEIVPVWKKEVGPGGQEWVGNKTILTESGRDIVGFV